MFISEIGENSGKNKAPSRVYKKRQTIIPQRAQAQNLSISAYVKNAAGKCEILYRDFPEIAEHTRYVQDLRYMIRCHIFTIESMGNYLDRDIEAIVGYVREIARSEIELLETMRRYYAQMEKEQRKESW